MSFHICPQITSRRDQLTYFNFLVTYLDQPQVNIATQLSARQPFDRSDIVQTLVPGVGVSLIASDLTLSRKKCCSSSKVSSGRSSWEKGKWPQSRTAPGNRLSSIFGTPGRPGRSTNCPTLFFLLPRGREPVPRIFVARHVIRFVHLKDRLSAAALKILGPWHESSNVQARSTEHNFAHCFGREGSRRSCSAR